MKESYYLKHDYNSRNDEKVLKLRAKLGIEGYGIYWMILEKLAESSEGRLKLEDAESLAYEMHTQCERITDVVRSFDLFKSNSTHFWSNRLMSDLAERNEKSKKASLAAKIKWLKEPEKMRTHSERNANAMQGEDRIGKEKKGKETNRESLQPSVSTPAQNMRNFLVMINQKEEGYVTFVEAVSKKTNVSITAAAAELDRFVNYWTEKSKNGLKDRWELEKTFEVQKRLSTWFQRSGQYSSNKKTNVGNI